MERKVAGRSQDIQERYPICPMHYYEIRTHLDTRFLPNLGGKWKSLTVSPVLTGKGKHLFTPEDSLQQLRLVFSRSTRTGGHNLIYQLIPR